MANLQTLSTGRIFGKTKLFGFPVMFNSFIENMGQKTFRILFENIIERGKIGWTTISKCKNEDEAIDCFRESFPFSEYELIQIAEVLD